jgi:hypothetical protein
MKNNYFKKVSLFLTCLTIACSTAFAGDGPVQGGGRTGGGGIGIGIDLGTVISIIKSATKDKCDPKVKEEALKTCQATPDKQLTKTELEACVKKACEVSKPTAVVIEPKKDDKDTKCEGEVADGAHYAYQHGAGKGMTEDAYVKKECEKLRGTFSNKVLPVKRQYQNQGSTCKVNGNFETGALSSWTGADNGSISPQDPIRASSIKTNWNNIPYTGIHSGAIGADTSHQTIVNAGVDPTVGALLQQLPPSGGNNAVRVGNNLVWAEFGQELLAKSFTVTPADAIVNFSYAVVLQNPPNVKNAGHPPNDQPAFSVIVRDGSGTEITNNIPGGRVHLSTGAAPNEMTADSTQPFFTEFVPTTPSDINMYGPNDKVLYKDWSCAQINLADMVGQNVTVEFITHDCGQSKHFGYAYIDDFCGTCTIKSNEGWLELAQSDKCGVGKVCVDVGIPNKKGDVGKATVSLDIWQNGVLVKTLTSPALTANGQYCFTIDPATISGLDLTKGFDYNATATMQSGSIILPVKTIGVPKDGTQSGQNNDYKSQCEAACSCGTATTPLCPACGQPGQPLCPACGQLGQPACPVQTACTPNMLGCIVTHDDDSCTPDSPFYPTCLHNPPHGGDCMFPPCKEKPRTSDPHGKPKTECIPKIKPMKPLPEKAVVKHVAKPRPKPVVSDGDAPKPVVHKAKHKARPKPAQNKSAPAEEPFDDGC